MSTRCQIIVKDERDQLWFYRHSDGYPEGVKESLQKFLDLVASGKIRNNVEQAAGWLVLIGAEEYGYPIKDPNGFTDWKVGYYEPCPIDEHGDIEYLYEVDLIGLTVRVKKIYYNKKSQRKHGPWTAFLTPTVKE